MMRDHNLINDLNAPIEAETHAQDLSPDFYQDPALTMASLLRMMTRFPSTYSPAMAQSIAGHFQLLLADGRQHPEIRLCAAELMQSWAQTATLLQRRDIEPAGALH